MNVRLSFSPVSQNPVDLLAVVLDDDVAIVIVEIAIDVVAAGSRGGERECGVVRHTNERGRVHGGFRHWREPRFCKNRDKSTSAVREFRGPDARS